MMPDAGFERRSNPIEPTLKRNRAINLQYVCVLMLPRSDFKKNNTQPIAMFNLFI